MLHHRLLFIPLSFLFSVNSLALSTDRDQPIQIEADKATIDNIKGIANYVGDVIVIQGSIRITSDTMNIKYSKTRNIETIVTTGNPSRFQQRLDNGEIIKAKALEMEYNAIQNIIYLRKQAELRKTINGIDNYISNAPRITYDSQRGIIRADKGKGKKGRITMTFTPEQKSK